MVESTPCAPGIIPNPNEGIHLIANIRPSHTLRAGTCAGCPFKHSDGRGCIDETARAPVGLEKSDSWELTCGDSDRAFLRYCEERRQQLHVGGGCSPHRIGEETRLVIFYEHTLRVVATFETPISF